MFRVSTLRLSADATRADAALAPADLGPLTAPELQRLLENLRTVDTTGPSGIDPCLDIRCHTRKFRVRPRAGRLLLFDLRDEFGPYAELSPEEIIARLAGAGLQGRRAALLQAGRRFAPRLLAIGFLGGALVLAAHTVRWFLTAPTVRPSPAVVLLENQGEIASRRQEIAGTFATGEAEGDRILVLRADGTASFSEVRRTGGPPEIGDSYRVVRRAGKTCLLTSEGGIIELLTLDTVAYYGDTYRRRR